MNIKAVWFWAESSHLIAVGSNTIRLTVAQPGEQEVVAATWLAAHFRVGSGTCSFTEPPAFSFSYSHQLLGFLKVLVCVCVCVCPTPEGSRGISINGKSSMSVGKCRSVIWKLLPVMSPQHAVGHVNYLGARLRLSAFISRPEEEEEGAVIAADPQVSSEVWGVCGGWGMGTVLLTSSLIPTAGCRRSVAGKFRVWDSKLFGR